MRGLYLAQGAMLVQQVRLEQISNNLANIQTPGYKRSETVQTSFGDYWIHLSKTTAEAGRGRLSPVGKMVHSVAIAATPTFWGGGALQETGKTMDLALAGPGFFEVEAAGERLYTRSGHFTLNEAGYLSLNTGEMVMGRRGPLYVGSGQIEVSRDGSVYWSETGEYIDHLRVVDFDPEADLIKSGNNLFRLEGGTPLPVRDTQVWAGFLEGSNVDLVREMSLMLEVRRSYEAAQRIMSSYDSILSKAANELGALR